MAVEEIVMHSMYPDLAVAWNSPRLNQVQYKFADHTNKNAF